MAAGIGLGLSGVALAMNLSFAFQFGLCALLVFSQDVSVRSAWDGWDSDSISSNKLSTFAQLAVPCAVAGCAESWGNRLIVMAR